MTIGALGNPIFVLVFFCFSFLLFSLKGKPSSASDKGQIFLFTLHNYTHHRLDSHTMLCLGSISHPPYWSLFRWFLTILRCGFFLNPKWNPKQKRAIFKSASICPPTISLTVRKVARSISNSKLVENIETTGHKRPKSPPHRIPPSSRSCAATRSCSTRSSRRPTRTSCSKRRSGRRLTAGSTSGSSSVPSLGFHILSYLQIYSSKLWTRKHSYKYKKLQK